MNRKITYLRVLVGLLVLMMAVPPWTLAQNSGMGSTFRQEELDQMLAPIALYPDSLLGQILVAATFPNEVVEADQWVRQNENVHGNALNTALDRMDWDLSVKALVPFPKVLSMMSDKMEWTQRLGDAFLVQQTDVLETVQTLRAKAHAHGNLNSTDQQKVVVKGDSIEILPTNPRVIYVPAYNPTSVYGSWWNPGYPPYAYHPYYPAYTYDPYFSGPGFITGGLFGFAAGIAVGSGWNWGWGRWDWGHRGHRYIRVNTVRTININRDLRRRDIRTTDLNRVVIQRRAGAARRAELRAIRQDARTRPLADTVQSTRRERRENAVQVRQGRSTRQGSRAGISSERGQVRRDTSTVKSRAQVRRDKTAVARSRAQVRRDTAAAKSRARVGRAQRPARSRGDSIRDADSRRNGGNSHGNDNGGGRGSR